MNRQSFRELNRKDERFIRINPTRAKQPNIDRKKVITSAGRLISFAKIAVPPKRRTQMLICKRLLFTNVTLRDIFLEKRFDSVIIHS